MPFINFFLPFFLLFKCYTSSLFSHLFPFISSSFLISFSFSVSE